MNLNEVYFYTASILQWKHLLKPDKYKQVILDSLVHLVREKKMVVYGFVIMPNHIHIILEMIAMNGKELPHESFMKFTGHQFLKDLQTNHPAVLAYFLVNQKHRTHQFWQRDALPVWLYTQKACEQKLDYIHLNPLQEHWNLASRPEDYPWSSAAFYELGEDRFAFLTHYKERF